MCSRCYICGEEVETVNHLFLQCRITSQLWRIFISLGGFAWAMRNKITHIFCTLGEKQGWELQIKIDGGLTRLVFGGLFGKKEILDVLRAGALIFKRSN
ncbi:hypothetical protein MTR67_037917 [Solanum verrucosum]|uniref:Reverse transcriptase zinc-binding domain-containing protein n=1 Tax=Solanum verrucosum TaxID=315347 RepID=A0AAF0UEJ9_SOLVR|nr:hypothetical protein MTR67_037917 [Solanum verrucosum]